ncbi:MAG: phosphatidylglycerophosphatase A [Bacteriovoracaceae bacterium]|nr:phosphatidylglycerophosphatase A [Bacteriovoracaceae bacterium]
MKDQNNKTPNRILLTYLSWFGSGYAPKAPGTFGTLASLPFIYAWSLLHLNIWINLGVIFLMTLLACLAAENVQKKLNLQDPQWIVIDEVVGMFLTWAIVNPANWMMWLACFVAFRFFDIIKIWPASYFDKKVKNGAGTILDDVVSGLYAGCLVQAVSIFLQRF